MTVLLIYILIYYIVYNFQKLFSTRNIIAEVLCLNDQINLIQKATKWLAGSKGLDQ